MFLIGIHLYTERGVGGVDTVGSSQPTSTHELRKQIHPISPPLCARYTIYCWSLFQLSLDVSLRPQTRSQLSNAPPARRRRPASSTAAAFFLAPPPLFLQACFVILYPNFFRPDTRGKSFRLSESSPRKLIVLGFLIN